MTIRRGTDWGEPGALPEGAPVVDDDGALARLVVPGPPPEVVGLVGGDLHRTLGGPHRTAEELRSEGGTLLVIDIGLAELVRPDGTTEELAFAAHVRVRTGGGGPFRHHTFVAMNAAFHGPDNLAPRAHPGDGVLDWIEGRLGLWDRLRVRRRLQTGTHVPHPDLGQGRGREIERCFDPSASVEVDGRPAGTAVAVRLRALPDAVTVLI